MSADAKQSEAVGNGLAAHLCEAQCVRAAASGHRGVLRMGYDVLVAAAIALPLIHISLRAGLHPNGTCKWCGAPTQTVECDGCWSERQESTPV